MVVQPTHSRTSQATGTRQFLLLGSILALILSTITLTSQAKGPSPAAENESDYLLIEPPEPGQVCDPLKWERLNSQSPTGRKLVVEAVQAETKPLKGFPYVLERAQYVLDANNNHIIAKLFSVNSVAWSADEKYLAAFETDERQIAILDIETQQSINHAFRPSEGIERYRTSYCWSHQGHRLLISSPTRAAVYDLDANKVILEKPGNFCFPRWSPDDRFISIQTRSKENKYWLRDSCSNVLVMDVSTGSAVLNRAIDDQCRAIAQWDLGNKYFWITQPPSKHDCFDAKTYSPKTPTEAELHWQTLCEQGKLAPDNSKLAVWEDDQVNFYDTASHQRIACSGKSRDGEKVWVDDWTKDSKSAFVLNDTGFVFVDSSSGKCSTSLDFPALERNYPVYLRQPDFVFVNSIYGGPNPQRKVILTGALQMPFAHPPSEPPFQLEEGPLEKFGPKALVPSTIDDCLKEYDRALSAEKKSDFSDCPEKKLSYYCACFVTQKEAYMLNVKSRWNTANLSRTLFNDGYHINDNQDLDLYIIRSYWRHLHGKQPETAQEWNAHFAN